MRLQNLSLMYSVVGDNLAWWKLATVGLHDCCTTRRNSSRADSNLILACRTSSCSA